MSEELDKKELRKSLYKVLLKLKKLAVKGDLRKFQELNKRAYLKIMGILFDRGFREGTEGWEWDKARNLLGNIVNLKLSQGIGKKERNDLLYSEIIEVNDRIKALKRFLK